MAITKLLRIKENKHGNNKSAGVLACLRYICDPEKTDNGRLVAGNAGGDPGFIYQEIVTNKESWGREHGSQAFHYIISFHPDEPVTPKLALKIAQEFCGELLGGAHIYTCAVHDDHEHVHVHICFDSINFKTGKLFRSGPFDWKQRLQPLTDRICQRHGLSALAYDESKEKTYMYHREWEDAKNAGRIKKDVSWTDIMRDDIDIALSRATDWADFISLLEGMHYSVRDGKYLSLKPEGELKAIRTVRLGPGYSKEELMEKIGKSQAKDQTEGRDYRIYGDPVPIFRSASSHRPCGQVQKDFYDSYMRLSHFRSPFFRSGWRYRKGVVQLSKLSDMCVYLFDHDITSLDDIKNRLKELDKARGREASLERRICNNICRRFEESQDPGDILHATDAPDIPIPDRQAIYQVRINRVLYGGDTPDLSLETFTARIPGSQEYIRLYSDDSRIYNNGDTISTYIYPQAEYQIETEDGHLLRRVTGAVVKEMFRSREIERQSDKNRQEAPAWIKK